MSTNANASDSAAFDLANYAPKLSMRLTSWTGNRAGERIWKKDPTFWPQAAPSDVQTRLGWLSLPTTMPPTIPDLRQFADAVRAEGFEHILLFGMGGSSLAPEVFARTFGSAPGFPDLVVVDSTHPEAVARLIRADAVGRTLFIVSSKSGTTLEPNAFFRYAWAKASAASPSPGKQFVAITDPGTPLQALAEQRGFRRCFLATSDVGGRYSALTAFGIVPCALIGHDPTALLASARSMSEACGPSVSVAENPGLRLGAALGELALAGRDKVIFLTSPGVSAFPSWVEQLIAESLGKQGRGLVPVPHESRPTESMGRRDGALVRLQLKGESDPAVESALNAASKEGMPVLRFEVADREELGREIFRWEFAVAAVGSVIGVNPFDQPDVELAKQLARDAMKPVAGAPAPTPSGVTPVAASSATLREQVEVWLETARPGDYIAIQAFLSPSAETAAAVSELGARLRDHTQLATTFGFGPRFLHSTGQMHKGGPPTGIFLQLVDEPTGDLEVPEMSMSFGRILKAQAAGDALALLQKGRRLLRVDLGADTVQGIRALQATLHR